MCSNLHIQKWIYIQFRVYSEGQKLNIHCIYTILNVYIHDVYSKLNIYTQFWIYILNLNIYAQFWIYIYSKSAHGSWADAAAAAHVFRNTNFVSQYHGFPFLFSLFSGELGWSFRTRLPQYQGEREREREREGVCVCVCVCLCVYKRKFMHSLKDLGFSWYRVYCKHCFVWIWNTLALTVECSPLFARGISFFPSCVCFCPPFRRRSYASMYMYIYIQTYTCMCTYVYTYMYMQVCIHSRLRRLSRLMK